MRLSYAKYACALCFGAVVQVQSLLLKVSQTENVNDSDEHDIALARLDGTTVSDSERFRARVNEKLVQVNHMYNDLVNDLVSARDMQAPATNLDVVTPTLDANDVRSATVAPASDTNDVTVSDSTEGPANQALTPVVPAIGEDVRFDLSAQGLAWLHTPKSGTSFANVVIAWGCPQLLGELLQTHHHAAIANKFCQAHLGDCPTAHSLCSSHSPINFVSDTADTIHSWRLSKGHFVGMFRKPEQRHISGFYDDQLMSTFGVDVYHGRYTTALDYAKANAGCSTKLLVGKPCNDKYNATVDMVEMAANHLEKGFAFVGLTEEWELSTCLFHRMFGGQCDPREFGNIRPGLDHSDEEYDTSELEGWIDPFDGPLYERAKLKFWLNVAKFGVSWENCRNSICPAAAQYF